MKYLERIYASEDRYGFEKEWRSARVEKKKVLETWATKHCYADVLFNSAHHDRTLAIM